MPLGVELRYRGVHPKAIKGLFHGKQIQHGFQCVDKGKRPRTRRDWKPNVQYKHLYSEALQCQVKVCVTTHALKRIDRAGGLDMYLLTTPAASRGSLVADELRKSIIKEYKRSSLGLPQKQGNTSIVSLADQRLREAGLRPPLNPDKSVGSVSDGNPSRVAAKERSAELQGDYWSPFVPIPYQDEPYRMRSERKTAVIQHILNEKGFADPMSAGGAVNKAEFAQARRLAARELKNQNRRQFVRKLSKSSRQQLERSLQIKKRMYLMHRRFSTDLSSGKRVQKPLLEAIRKAKIEWRRKVTRKNNRIASKRGQARNEVLKRIASSPEASMFLRFAWLNTFVDEMPDGPGKEAWRMLAEKYKPSTPGMLIDGVFVPATSNRGVLSKQDTLPHLEVPPTVSPPSPSEALTSRATAEDILDAANAVAYLPPDSSLLPHTEMKMEQESVERARRLHDMQVRQSHADKLYSLMRDMKQKYPLHADAIESCISDKLKPLGTVIDSTGGIVDAYVKHGGLDGTLRMLLQAAAANKSAEIANTGTATTASNADSRTASSAVSGKDSKLSQSGAGSTRSSPPSGPADSKEAGNGAAEDSTSLSAGSVRRMINKRMEYSQRKQIKKLGKWLDDEWLKKNVAYATSRERLVLGNGMMLASRSHKEPMPNELWEELQAACERIQIDIDRLASSRPGVPETGSGGRFITLPGVPGSWVPS